MVDSRDTQAWSAPSVVLLKVYPENVSVSPFEGDPPRAIDGDREAHGLAVELVQSPPRHVQLPQGLRRVESCQSPSNAVEQVAADPFRIVLVPERRQPFVQEAPDHPPKGRGE